MSPTRFHEITQRFRDLRIAIIGDVMCDHYLYGKTNRISAEAPVPVIEVERQSYNLGGAANVANNLLALRVRPILFGVVGDDAAANAMLGQMRELEMETAGIVRDTNRPTTIKMRTIAHGQQVARADIESTAPIRTEVERQLLEGFAAHLPNVDAVIFEDYNKGVITPSLIRVVTALCRENQKIVTVDPKFENFFAYQNVTVFKPNRHETETSFGKFLRNDQDILEVSQVLLTRLTCRYVLMTLGADGMALVDSSRGMVRLPVIIRNFRDSSGAGDTVIGTLTAALAAGAMITEAAALANYAAGVACEKFGVQTVTAAEILEAINHHEPRETAFAHEVSPHTHTRDHGEHLSTNAPATQSR